MIKHYVSIIANVWESGHKNDQDTQSIVVGLHAEDHKDAAQGVAEALARMVDSGNGAARDSYAATEDLRGSSTGEREAERLKAELAACHDHRAKLLGAIGCSNYGASTDQYVEASCDVVRTFQAEYVRLVAELNTANGIIADLRETARKMSGR